ncbi:signal peptidase I [Laceyella sacchari]|jgi:signal peptidase I|uniref:Signal peptidase I n=2 Tax=Laceyella TaxID=292635 RepID=A0ABY5U9I0_LACSH|nr:MULTISPECIES: signal peptidase I [Laceyella]KPC77784.1 signal peptidase [Thermoactinomyces vulgaris]MRG29216.1 signal peptidase I [Laceyella tengchongensis]AUS08477.1 signal peptidase I [Laceyella sacchari]PRZ15781.1 signal peptidase I [Laceyella sediminis]TCW41140.1 signal peptidase I [Laceyella sacchari]
MRIAKELLAWGGSIFFGIAFALFISIFVFQPTKVLGSSMEPTLKPNHHIYVSKLPRTFTYKPRIGDIVIIDSRVNRARTWKDDLLDTPLFSMFKERHSHDVWVKRVIGLPGDTIMIKSNQVYRNGQRLKEDYIKEAMIDTPDAHFVIPENQIFVMGDNRNNSRDSREIGSIPIDHVLGVKIF